MFEAGRSCGDDEKRIYIKRGWREKQRLSEEVKETDSSGRTKGSQ